MMRELPRDALDVIDATIAAARLGERGRSDVRLELESHFLDGLDAGVPLEDLIDRFGDPLVTGRLIRRTKRRPGGAIRDCTLTGAAIAAGWYLVAFVRLATAPAGPAMPHLEAEARYVAESVARSDAALSTPAAILAGFDVASDLRGRRTLWAETASLLLLDRVMSAADSLLTADDRQALVDSLRALARRETLAPRLGIIMGTVPLVVRRVHGLAGRVDQGGLQLWRHTKGVTTVSAWARLLEPLYFSGASSLAETRHEVVSLIGARVALAEIASRRLSSRL